MVTETPGSQTVKVVPRPAVDSTRMAPPCASTIRRAIGSPSPPPRRVEKFSSKMSIRPFKELYRALDLYYRLHWYALEYDLRGEFDVFDLSRFIERRRALEWLLRPDAGWDEVPMNT